jgi:hypothetical protein
MIDDRRSLLYDNFTFIDVLAKQQELQPPAKLDGNEICYELVAMVIIVHIIYTSAIRLCIELRDILSKRKSNRSKADSVSEVPQIGNPLLRHPSLQDDKGFA